MSFGAFVLFVKSSESFHLNYKLGKEKRWKWETCSPHHCTFQVFPFAFILLLLSIKRKENNQTRVSLLASLVVFNTSDTTGFSMPGKSKAGDGWVFFSLPLLLFWLTIHDRLRRQKKVMYLQLLIFFLLLFKRENWGGSLSLSS